MSRSHSTHLLALAMVFAAPLFGQSSTTKERTIAGLESRIARLEKRLASVEAQLANITAGATPPSVTVGTFNRIPDEFAMGAGCSYAKTPNGKPVFIEDMGGSAVMILNGRTVELTFLKQSDAGGGATTNVYTNSDFEVTKTTTSKKTGHESAEEEGHITVKAKGGGIARERIYGACGA